MMTKTFTSNTKSSCNRIPRLVESFRAKTGSPRELAVAIHDFVRDIPFGFTDRHDGASADYTLKRNRGHCVPKSELLVQLLREACFADASLVGVKIPGTVLHYLGPKDSSPFPRELHHAFVQVTVEGHSCRLDSYVLDPPLFRAAKERLLEVLASRGVEAGWGVHIEGVCEWNGKDDAFSQYVPSTHGDPQEEHPYASSEVLAASPGYAHKDLRFLLGIPLLGSLTMGAWLERSNSQIDLLRKKDNKI